MATRKDLVPTSILRERFLELQDRGQVTFSSLAERIGWHQSGRPDRPDVTRVGRALGIYEDPQTKGLRQGMTPATAVLTGGHLGLDPVDLGI